MENVEVKDISDDNMYYILLLFSKLYVFSMAYADEYVALISWNCMFKKKKKLKQTSSYKSNRSTP